MKNGLYKVHFQTPLGQGTGVVVVNNGRLSGGDSLMYYSGTYEESGNKFNANVLSAKHSTIPGMQSVFGKDRVNIKLSGSSTESSAVCKGSSPDAPGISFSAELSRLCD